MFSDEVIKCATKTLQMARDKGYSLATAESCTGGLIIGALTEITGASDVVDRGFVTYSNQSKIDILKIAGAILDHHGAVSEECAKAMAIGAITASNATFAVSVTGVAGPDGGTKDKPVGLVHIACSDRDFTLLHEKYLFGNIGRGKVREATILAALKLFQKAIE